MPGWALAGTSWRAFTNRESFERMTQGALGNIRIVDLTQIWSGVIASRILGDMGAQLLKIEAARRYDNCRNYGALPNNQPGERPYNRRALFNMRNRNKLGITLDLSTVKGKELFKRLVAISDVVMENFSARVMRNLGLDYAVLRQVKPSIVMISMPAFGMSGPEKDYIGQGTNLTPLTGLVGVTGYPDRGPHHVDSYTDHVAGVTAVGAVMAALLYRLRTGRGQYIDLSQREASIRFLGDAVLDYGMNGRVAGPRGNRHPWMAPHGCYPSKGNDAWVTIAVGTEEQWQALCRVIGHPEWVDDPRFATSLERWKHQAELGPVIAAWTRERDHYEAMRLLQDAGVPCGPVLNAKELLEDPHLKSRGFFWKTGVAEAPELGEVPIVGPLWKFSRTPGTFRSPAPRLGEHNAVVFGEILGMSAEEIAALEAEGVVGGIPAARPALGVSSVPQKRPGQ